MWVHLSPISNNIKTGPIPVSTTEESSCPKECPHLGTDCYARFGALSIHWRAIGKTRGDNWKAFCDRMRKFRKGTLFRHNQAGDLPKNSRGKIHKTKMRQLIDAVKHLRGFTYTHYDATDPHNQEIILESNKAGFLVNLSADSLTQADQYAKIGPTVVTLPSDAKSGVRTPEGRIVVICPAQTQEGITCASCKLCSKNRKSIVGFLAHGTASKRLSQKLRDSDE